MLTALMILPVFAIVFVSAAGYGRAMDELFGAPRRPLPPRRATLSAEPVCG